MYSLKVVVDSDVFVALLFEQEVNHQTAIKLRRHIESNALQPVTTGSVLFEVVRLLRERSEAELAYRFLQQLQNWNFPILPLSDGLLNDALTMYRKQKTKGLSLSICANVAIMREYHIPKIATFDGRYEQLGVQVVGT